MSSAPVIRSRVGGKGRSLLHCLFSGEISRVSGVPQVLRDLEYFQERDPGHNEGGGRIGTAGAFLMKKIIVPKFSRWARWAERHSLQDIQYPGVYALAVSGMDLADSRFDWIREIVYFGMTNSGGGLKARLYQFDNTIAGKEGHGGGQRVRYKYRNYDRLTERLFLSLCPIKCDTRSNAPDDLLKMGEVAYVEYYCFAKYARLFGQLPEFNDKKSAPKLKRTRS